MQESAQHKGVRWEACLQAVFTTKPSKVLQAFPTCPERRGLQVQPVLGLQWLGLTFTVSRLICEIL